MRPPLASLLIISASLCGCATDVAPVSSQIGTLADIPDFPRDELASYLPVSDWMTISDRECAGYVEMLASIHEDGSVHVGRVVKACPDASRNEAARVFAKGVVLRATKSDVSLLPDQGEIYVVFFKPDRGESLILLYGRQTVEPKVPKGGRMVFANRPIDGIRPVVSYRAKFAQILISH